MTRDRQRQIDLGAYYTPTKTVDYILRCVGIERLVAARRIVEPCGGDGIFVRRLLDAGVPAMAIEVWDLDADAEAAMRDLGVRFSLGDTLARDIPEGSVDCVVGNPPYLNKHSAYIRQNKTWLTRKFKAVGASETYAMFTYAMVRSLREGGRLGFIVSDTFLTTGIYRRFRDWLLNNTRILEISQAPPRLFNAAVSTVILIVERCSDSTARDANIVRIYDRVETEDDYGDPGLCHEVRQNVLCRTPNHAFLPVPPEVLRLFREYPSLGSAGLIGHIGMHTRNNARFLLPAATDEAGVAAQMARIEAGDLVPYLKTGGVRDYWAPVAEYLRWDEASRQHYEMPSVNLFGTPGVAVSGVSERLSARILEPGCYWDTNKVIGFRNETGYTDEVVVGILNTRLYNYLAKRVLNATSSLQIEDIRALPLIRLTEHDQQVIDHAVRKIVLAKRSGQVDLSAIARIRREIDAIVEAAAGIPDTLARILDAERDMTDERRERSAAA